MIAILSPAKRMEISKNDFPFSTPHFLNETGKIINVLKSTNPPALQKLMKISPKLADLNFQRHLDFDLNHTKDNSTQAFFAYKGDVYRGLEADTLDKTDLEFGNQHIRIISGLYGLLNPLDLIQPYRLEMGTKLKTSEYDNLYKLWKEISTKKLNFDIKQSGSDILLNLASDEYYKAIEPKDINAQIIKVHFKEYKGEQLKFISFNGKKARGMMSKYIIKNKINDAESIKGFDYEGYYFVEEDSNENEYLFVK